jgi:hypothetical protein
MAFETIFYPLAEENGYFAGDISTVDGVQISSPALLNRPFACFTLSWDVIYVPVRIYPPLRECIIHLKILAVFLPRVLPSSDHQGSVLISGLRPIAESEGRLHTKN